MRTHRSAQAVLAIAALIATVGCGSQPSDAPADALSIAPPTLEVAPGDKVHFNATLDGTPNQPVAWSASSGTIDTTGTYTAPTSEGVYTVTASLSGTTRPRRSP